MRAYWSAMKERIAASDEIAMATLRYRLRMEGEAVTETSDGININKQIIERDELGQVTQRQVGQ